MTQEQYYWFVRRPQMLKAANIAYNAVAGCGSTSQKEEFKLTVTQVANDGKTPINGACEISEILSGYLPNTEVTITITPNIIYDNVKYTFLRWSDGVTDLTRTIKMVSDISLNVIFDVTPIETNLLTDLYKQINIDNNSDGTDNKVYYQTEDIDLTNINLTAIPDLNLSAYNGSTVWPGIGTSKTNAFKGIYIGNNHTIKVKYTAQKQNAPGAVFAYTDGATFKDIIVNVDGTDDNSQMIKYCAGLVGECYGSTRSDNFINIIVNGTIGSIDHHVQYGAGICGKIHSRSYTTNFTNCINNANIYATGLNGASLGQKIGGICAYASGHDTSSPGAKFENCENHGNITTNADYANLLTENEGIGGILGNSGAEGKSQLTYINNCKSTGRITFADASGNSNIKNQKFSVGQIIGMPRNLKFMGNIYITPGFRACKSTSSIGRANEVPFVIGYYDETDDICTKNNLIKLIPASQIKDGKLYHTVFTDITIQIPPNVTSIELDTTAANNTVKDSKNNVLTGEIIDTAKPNIMKYTIA